MTDRPIPFSPPMVRAILREIEQPGTGKTQTRRILKPQPEHYADGRWHVFGPGGGVAGVHTDDVPERAVEYLAVSPGDRLWVKEAWRTYSTLDGHPPRDLTGMRVWYEADAGYKPQSRYRHARFMPRWASRITLLVTDVRVERLNDISEADAMAEGMPASVANSPRVWFMTLWNRLHGPGSWEANPWVAVYGFRPVLANIDQTEQS